MERPFEDCMFLTGPTASGKSAIAVSLAERLGAEIVAMDSMTLYRGMDIGTAKPGPHDRARVPHHLLDVLDSAESASVDWYLRQAKRTCDAIRERGRRPLFVGGTPLYLKAVLRGLFDGPPGDPELRASLEAEAMACGAAHLHRRLEAIDRQAAARIHPSDTRRIVRALEVYAKTGTPISLLQREFDRPAEPPPPVACLVRPRSELAARIDHRIKRMFEAGWVEEVRALQLRPLGREASQAVGYREIADHLTGTIDEGEMRARIRIRTRRFAKHQMTWFRHLEECRFFDIEPDETLEHLVDRLAEFLAQM